MENNKKRPFLVHLPAHVHHLLSFVADEQGRTMSDLAREALWAAIEIHMEEHHGGGRGLAPTEAGMLRDGCPEVKAAAVPAGTTRRLWDDA